MKESALTSRNKLESNCKPSGAFIEATKEKIDQTLKSIVERDEAMTYHDPLISIPVTDGIIEGYTLHDEVNQPSHYTDTKIEVIDYIEDKNFGYCLGNAVKYISRAGKKDPSKTVQDLEKAIWYINRHIQQLEK